MRYLALAGAHVSPSSMPPVVNAMSYIPQDLTHISDPQRSPDGTWSYYSTSDSLNPVQQTVSADVGNSTFDPKFIAENPMFAAKMRINSTTPPQWQDEMATSLADKFRGLAGWATQDQLHTTGTSGVLGAGLGALLARRFGASKGLGALLGGLLAGGGAALAGNWQARDVANFNKQSSHDKSAYSILQALASDTSMGSLQKSQLQQALMNMTPSDQQALARTLRGATGAGVGALIARFLLKRGLLGSLLGALLGAYLIS